MEAELKTPEMFKLCVVLSMIDDCKMYGLLTGGFEINKEKIEQVIDYGQEHCFDYPDEHDVNEILLGINQAIVEANNEMKKTEEDAPAASERSK